MSGTFLRQFGVEKTLTWFVYTGEDVPIGEDIDKNFVIPLMMLERYGDGILKTLVGYPADKAVEECEAK